MKNNNLILDIDDFEDISIGLLKINDSYKDHQFFYQLNQLNCCHFRKEKDFIYEGKFYTYYHSVFKGYLEENKTSYTLISNQSFHAIRKKEITELFVDEKNVNYLLKNHEFNGFLIKTRPINTDFSLLLFPDNTESIKILDIDASQDIYYQIESYE